MMLLDLQLIYGPPLPFSVFIEPRWVAQDVLWGCRVRMAVNPTLNAEGRSEAPYYNQFGLILRFVQEGQLPCERAGLFDQLTHHL
jgi:hypothetical protein